MAAYANVIANAFRNCSFAGAVQRQEKESVMGNDNSSKTVQKRAGAFKHDEWDHFCLKRLLVYRKYEGQKYIKKRLMLLDVEDRSMDP